MTTKKTNNIKGAGAVKPKPLVCGLVMPISALDGCTEEHWGDVKAIITEAVESIQKLKFNIKPVSVADDVGVIQKRIVQNIYNSDIVICDVSGKNPNVMFELGMRLAFDKPTVIVIDGNTDYAFDTGIIEHISYPRDLRFNRMVAFKSSLADKVLATYKAAQADPNHSTFLKNFGKFQVANLSENAVPADKLAVEMLTDMQVEIAQIRRMFHRSTNRKPQLRSVDGESKILDELTRYLDRNPKTSVQKLADDKDFLRFMVDKCEARDYFSSESLFANALDRVISSFPQSAN